MSRVVRKTFLVATIGLVSSCLAESLQPELLYSVEVKSISSRQPGSPFPSTSPDETLFRIEKGLEQQYNRCPPYEDSLLSSFTYGLMPDTGSSESESNRRFSILKCYAPSKESSLGIVAIIMEDFGPREESRKGYYLSYFLGRQKMYEQSFEASYGARYGFKEIPSDPQLGPLLLVYRNEGANAREITYDLYRIQRESLKLVWRWKDEVSHSTSHSFSISNVDLSRLASVRDAMITVFTTSGSYEEKPIHKTSVFKWDGNADTFVPNGDRKN